MTLPVANFFPRRQCGHQQYTPAVLHLPRCLARTFPVRIGL
jgi:hypothetical protein